MSNLQLKNINKIYPNGFQAVYDFNIDINEGEFIVIVGPSGCGKSTVLRMIAGLEGITSGDLFLMGKRINEVAPADRKLAMVFQDYALYFNMTTYENIAFSLTLRHEDKDVIHSKVMKTAGIVNLKEYLNRRPRQLSGGQRQRVALGRAIAKSVNLLLMDEPLSNLDAKLREKTRREIVDLHNELNLTVIYVTHDQIEAMTMADRIVVMNEGHIQQIGTPREVYHNPENIFVACFIGNPPMNLFHGEIVNDKFVADKVEVKIPEEKMKILEGYQGKKVIMGVRPEYFTINSSELATYSDSIIEGKVDIVEFLGANVLIYFTVGEDKIVAKLNSKNVNISNKDSIKLAVLMDKVHFFDAETEKRIR